MRTIRRLAVLALLSPLSLQAQAGQVVGPGGSSTVGNPTGWQPDAQFGATAEVTRTNPCGTAALGVWTNNACSGGYAGVGAGSLEMHLAGNNQAGGLPNGRSGIAGPADPPPPIAITDHSARSTSCPRCPLIGSASRTPIP